MPRPKGFKHSEETKLKMSQARKGIVFSPSHLKNLSISHLGQKGYWTDKKRGKMSEEQKEKVRLSNLGKHFFNNNPRYGKDNNKWKGGITPINAKIRKSRKYKEWRKAVFERDNYTCQECKVRAVYLNADHIKPFAYFKELRFLLDNGRTLCIDCHRKTETWGVGKKPRKK